MGFRIVYWGSGRLCRNLPITGFGKFIACIVGLLGIAIVAVPAGILGSRFTEAIEHKLDNKKLKAN